MSARRIQKSNADASGLEWHPIHNNILASGDAAGALIYWSLLSPNPSIPDTVLEAAHDDAINTLSFHPLGHLLCTGSKDFTARFWSRARPVGGQENDKFHLGEEKAMRAQYDEERASKRQRPDEDHGQVGLPGLGGAPDRPIPPPATATLPGLGGLPGLGNAPPPQAVGAAPMRSWGGDAKVGSGRAPLPSQGDMLRNTGGYGDERGASSGRAPLPSGYGNDRPGQAPPPMPNFPPNGYGQQGQAGPPNGYGGMPNGGGYGNQGPPGGRDPYGSSNGNRYGNQGPGGPGQGYGGQGWR